MNIDPTTALDFFQQPRVLSSDHDPNQWNGYRDDMSCGIQGGYRAYISGDKEPRCERGRLRWGYAWNNEGAPHRECSRHPSSLRACTIEERVVVAGMASSESAAPTKATAATGATMTSAGQAPLATATMVTEGSIRLQYSVGKCPLFGSP